MALLEIEGLHVDVGGKPILKGIDLTIEPGEVHAIMGPNGSGKSTLSYVLAGRDGYEVTAGSIRFDGQDLLEMAADERAVAGIFLSLPVVLIQASAFVGGIVAVTLVSLVASMVRNTDRTWDVVDVVSQIADAHGRPMGQIAIAWLLTRPGVASAWAFLLSSHDAWKTGEVEVQHEDFCLIGIFM